MAKHKKRLVRVRFSPRTGLHEPPPNPLHEAVRGVYITKDSMTYCLREILSSEKRSYQRQMMQRLRVEFRQLGDALIGLDKEIEK